MFYALIIILFSCFFASQYQKNCVFEGNFLLKTCGWNPRRSNAKLLYGLLITLVVLYSGLRSRTNDTWAYIFSFTNHVKGSLSAIRDVDFSWSEEPGFAVYEILVKTIFGNNYSRFLTITAWITCGSYIAFFRKYSSDFSFAVYLFFTTTFYSFTFAAIRQCFAIAIAIWALPCFAKGEKLKGILLVLLGSSCHKLVILYVVALFLRENVWSGKTLLIILATIIVAVSYNVVLENVADISGYDEEYLFSAGTNILRTFVWLVPVVLSFVYKDRINRSSSIIAKMVINMSLVGSMIMILAGIAGGNLVARAAHYFFPFFVLSFTELIKTDITGGNTKLFRTLCGICFFFYYMAISWDPKNFFVDKMYHNSITALFYRR